MASSRKSPNPNNDDPLVAAFERALGAIRARVSVSAIDAGDAVEAGMATHEGQSAATDASADPRQSAFAIGVGYSGGLDSSVLLSLAIDYGRRHGIRVEALHVHHGLSPNADAWTDHCEQVCRQAGVALHVARVSVAGSGQGIEAAARNARYAALGRICTERALPVLLTAHHQDDQAETVLLQLVRGAGVAGLSGMAAVSAKPGLLGSDVLLARPLLDAGRAQLEAFARRRGLQWISDESNDDPRYRRNALRHQVLPLLDQVFAGCVQVVARSARHLQSARQLLDDLARIDLVTCAATDGESLDILRLRQLPAARADNLLRYWLAGQEVPMPSTARLQQLREQMLGAAADRHPLLVLGEVAIRRVAGSLRIEPAPMAGNPQPVQLEWQGEAVIEVPSWLGRLTFVRSEAPALPEAALRAGAISLQTRAGQERLKPAPNRPSRTLKNLFQEHAIPAWRRPWLPLIRLDGRLLAVGGIGMDCRLLVDEPGWRVEWQADLPLADGRHAATDSPISADGSA